MQVTAPRGAGLTEFSQALVEPVKGGYVAAAGMQAGGPHEFGLVHEIEAEVFRITDAGEDIEAAVQVGHRDGVAPGKADGGTLDHRLDGPPVYVVEIRGQRAKALPIGGRGHVVLAPTGVFAKDEFGPKERGRQIRADVGHPCGHGVAQTGIGFKAGKGAFDLEIHVEPTLAQGCMGGARGLGRGRVFSP